LLGKAVRLFIPLASPMVTCDRGASALKSQVAKV
jgi:hypothetical protein